MNLGSHMNPWKLAAVALRRADGRPLGNALCCSSRDHVTVMVERRQTEF